MQKLAKDFEDCCELPEANTNNDIAVTVTLEGNTRPRQEHNEEKMEAKRK